MWKSAFATICAVLATISTSGCQSWGPSAFPMNNVSRVSPPGTGTYTVPNGYYNQTSSLGNAPPGMTAGPSNTQLPLVQGGLPTTSLAAQGADPRSVLPAQFTSSPTGLQAGQFQPPSGAAQPPAGVSTAQFTSQVAPAGSFGGPGTASSLSDQRDHSQADGYQAGNYETRDISGSANVTFSDVPDVTADPELQWRP